ncbi:MAG TPA: hypothetical protein VNO81_12000 [Candidatus Nitrosotenuis sp.]|nr:hypothetical protein [Candidatus Nitrosotenuis sp.]
MSRRSLLLTLALGLMPGGPLWAQLKLPPQDDRGRSLVPLDTLELALRQQQTLIYVLVALLALAIGGLIYQGILLQRMQFTVERVAEAVRRVDLLALAYSKVTAEWGQPAPLSDPEDVHPLLDLDDEPPPARQEPRRRPPK